MAKFKNALKKMKSAWDAGRKQAARLEIGKYVMQLQECVLGQNKKGGLQIQLEHYVLEGEMAGYVQRDQIQIGTEIGMMFATRFIEAMGYEAPEDPEDLEEVLAAIKAEAPVYNADITHDGDYCRVRVDSLIEEYDGERPAPKEEAAAEEEAPADDDDDEGEAWAVGNRCIATIEDVEYAGEITALNEEDDEVVSADITFDDGDEQTIGIEEIVDEEGEGGEADAGAAEEDKPEDFDDLLEFAQAQKLDVTDESTRDEIIDAIKTDGTDEFEYEMSKLTEDEIALLKSIGADLVDDVTKAKPKKASKKAAKKAGKKATKKSAKKSAAKKKGKRKK